MPQHPKDLQIADFVYELPDERIAKFPLAQRDQSKLLSFKAGNITDHIFQEVADLLPANSLLLFNDTKVVQARLFFTRATGSVVEVFCLEPVSPTSEIQQAMQQTGSCVWRCMVGNAKKWKEPVLELPFQYQGKNAILKAEKTAQETGSYLVQFSWEPAELTFAEVLAGAGNLPLPPYFKRDATEADQSRYQTVYARQEGAVAAPTAGLHFTPKIFEKLKAKGIKTAYLTLHVGAGTFKPVKAEKMADHDMHAEQIIVSKTLIEQLLGHFPNPVIPVGTTSMRTLESLYWLGVKLRENPDLKISKLEVNQWQPYEAKSDFPVTEALQAILTFLAQNDTDFLPASTQIIIAPGYEFKICSGLITNFHQPGSTLLLLVSALVGENWKKIYAHALANNYRFLSYGDSSLLMA
ncbi:S-adenosylmethionine:tRNA ribosyltransferase-isomerase [Adhaeribacter sp. BT258]|uniref:S-adenosylmethionine:tRNA ribosyltransferase-isomerase n=1 Tax=Adhaeribacter terrigena TaxID=2793070 RepID=A0ABS1BYQ4_9BACT|nr:S-adenosylmethionine:tRNA ribosyltransferase-isomerase [Adhaeribacter terrigena]MBK0402289.1 S-adenosylmethionine:tRNA ribosyltransferase-isomerase [Adhaeribacter terrigena]